MEPLKQFDCTHCGEMADICAGDKSPPCPHCGKDTMKQVFTVAPAYHNRYSFLHPQRKKGMGGTKPPITKSEAARIERQTALREVYAEGYLDE